MANNHKFFRAFTLAEIFIAMLVLSVLVSVCTTYFIKRHDYSREYGYYTAYQNLVNVVEASLYKNEYLGTRIEETDCGVASPINRSHKCRAYKSGAGVNSTNNLCSIFADYFNTVSTSCATTFASAPTASTSTSSLKVTNGMVFYFKNASPTNFESNILEDANLHLTERQGYTLWIDVNGHGVGEDKENYDIMKFYITRSGKVIPAYGSVTGLRGYDFVPAAQDAGGNPSLMAFDVIYREDADASEYTVLGDAYRFVPFPVAACSSGYVSMSTSYCSNFHTQNPSTHAWDVALALNTTCSDNAYADCKIRLVKKLRRNK